MNEINKKIEKCLECGKERENYDPPSNSNQPYLTKLLPYICSECKDKLGLNREYESDYVNLGMNLEEAIDFLEHVRKRYSNQPFEGIVSISLGKKEDGARFVKFDHYNDEDWIVDSKQEE